MKKFISISLLVVMLLSMTATAFAEADIRDFSFTMDGTIAAKGYYYVSSETATKYGSNYKYGSVRVKDWHGCKPSKNIYVGLAFDNYVPACTFEWMNVTKPLSIRVTPKLNDPSLVGSDYKYCASMRLNTVETVATVKANGIFTPDGR